jgi:hypothetical protein
MVRWTFAVVLLLVFGLGLGLQQESGAQEKVNGAVIGTGGQGYKAKADCKHGIDIIMKGAAKAKVEDETAK